MSLIGDGSASRPYLVRRGYTTWLRIGDCARKTGILPVSAGRLPACRDSLEGCPPSQAGSLTTKLREQARDQFAPELRAAARIGNRREFIAQNRQRIRDCSF